MRRLKKLFVLSLLSVTAVFTAGFSDANAAAKLTPEHLYSWAKENDTARLNKYKHYINIENQDKNTALCLAQQNKDRDAYALLLKFGASTKVPCHDDNDPVCAIIVGEKVKVSPAGLALIGVGAAAGAYALLHDDDKGCDKSKYPLDECPEHGQCSHCKGKNRLESCDEFWTPNADKTACIPVDCPTGEQTSCEDKADHITTATPTANKSGDQQCYQCSYTCNEKDKRYDNLGFCAAYHPGIVCELNENQCWYPAKCDTSKGYYDNDDECRNSNPGYTCKTVTNGCYIKDVCDIANGHHPNQASCENANIGYHCTQQENLCWLPNFTLLTECLPNSHTALCETQTGIISTPTPVSKSGPDDCLECDYKCDTASGWQQGSAAANCRAGRVCRDVAINDTNRNKTLICYRDDGCPTDFTYYTTLAACEAGGYVCTESAPGSECWRHSRNAECPDTHPSRNQCQTGTGFTNGQTETPVGDAPCYNCDYQCDTANGWQTTCPAGRKCTDITMPNGKKCYNNTTSACPPDYPYTNLSKCEEDGYVCAESAPGSQCWKHDGNADCPASHPNRTQCQTGTGYTNGQTETQVGDAPCYNCNYQCDTAHSWFATCPAGKTCSEITMPSGAKCYTPTGCDTTHGYFDNTTACQNANPEHVCTIDATGCYVVGVCDAAHGYYATDTACTAANPSYTCVKTAHNCYVKDDPAGCPTPSHINECLTVDGIKTTPSVVAKSGEDDCYDCTYLCDTANGWQSGTASNCPTGWLCKYASLTDPYRSKGADCYKKDKCDPTQGYYDNNTACTTANSEYTCIVDVTGCYTKNICNTTKGYYATKALCEQAAENIGYQCAQSAGGCWKKNAAPTPCTPPSNTAQCLVDSTNAILTTPNVTGQSGTSDCYDCDYQCNTTAGWKQGTAAANCPAGKDCSETSINDTYRNKSITCYHDDGCPAGYTATTKAACESGGFTCSESAPGSGCWKQTGDQDCPDDYQETPCTDAKTGITLVPHTPITVGSKLCYKCEYECNNALAYKDDSTLTVCGTTADNGWKFINPVDQGSASCAQCEKLPCDDGSATIAGDCETHTSLKADLGSSSTGYNGDTKCYACTYSCDEDNDYYADKDQCEDGGTRTCTRVDKTVNSRTYTCWKREGVFRCPEGEQKDHCTPSATGFKTSETPKNYEGGTCYVCSYACDTANGWQAGSSCPAGKSCPDGTNKITTPLACIKPICPTTHSYTSKATCQAGGYTCLESATGSGCWMRSGCPSTYPYTSQSACQSGGFTCEESTTDTGCWRHKGDQPCPSTHPNETACATPTKSGIKLDQQETTVGSRKCYSCSYDCDTANGWKSSNCPIGTAFTGTCNTEHGATCGKITGCSTTNGYKNTTDIYNCGTSGSNGWKFINSQTKDGTTCAQCEKLPCDDGSATIAGDCETHTSLKADLGSSSTGYNGDTKCYACTYSCDEDNGFYTYESECTSSGSYECHIVTYLTGHSCWERGDPSECPSGYGESACTSSSTYIIATQLDKTTVGSKNCYKCQYTCACDQTQGAGMRYSRASITTNLDETVNCNYGSSCDTASFYYDTSDISICGSTGDKGWVFTSTTTSCDFSCGKCQAKSCSTGYATTLDSCETKTGLTASLGSASTTRYNGNNPCYLCSYKCDPNQGYYETNSACISGGYTCGTTAVSGRNCYYRTNCPTGYTETACSSLTVKKGIVAKQVDHTTVGSKDCYKCSLECDSGWEDSTEYWNYSQTIFFGERNEQTLNGTTTRCTKITGCNFDNGYYDRSTSTLEVCGTSGSNGWDWDGAPALLDGYACSSCLELPCDTGTATTAGNCPDSYASLVASIGTSAVDYTGDTPCYTCNYSCDESNGYYATESACANGGYTCEKVEESGYATCYHRTGNSECPGTHPSETACATPTKSGIKLTQDETTVGSRKCYSCSYGCDTANGWKSSNCPIGTAFTGTCNTEHGATCGKITGCSTTNGYYDTSSIYNCGTSGDNGWKFITPYQTAGSYSCAKCEKKLCPTGQTTQLSGCAPYDSLTASLGTSSGSYSGDSPCYPCNYTCNEDENYYADKGECENGDSYTCTQTTENGKTCWHRGGPKVTCNTSCRNDYPYITFLSSSTTGKTDSNGNPCVTCTYNCKSEVGYYGDQGACQTATGTQCVAKRVDYTLNNNEAANLGCYIQGGDDIPCDDGYSTTYQSVANCGTSGTKGWDFASSGMSDGKVCGKCTAKACATGSTTYSNASNCPTAEAGFKVSSSAITDVFAGDTQCYQCNYACDETVGFSSNGSCTGLLKDGWNCSEKTQGTATCHVRTGCTRCPLGYLECDYCPGEIGTGTVCKVTQGPIIDEPIQTLATDIPITNQWSYKVGIPNKCAPSGTRCGKCDANSAAITSTATGLQNEIYGMRGTSSEPLVNEKENTISLQNLANTTAIGMFSDQSQTVINQGTINIETNIEESQNSTAIGIHAGLGVEAINQGLIKIDGKDGTAIGILGEGANHIVNAEDGIIDVTGAKAYGIYVKDGEGALVENKGIIKALGDEAHGIYIEKNANVNTVLNSGSIYVNGTEKGDAGITLNGADLRNEKILAFSGKANLDMLDGRIYLEKGGSIEAEALEGDLTLGVSNVLGSNEDTYAAEGALKADDLANLNLISESALFDAKVTADGHRLERKDFAEFTPNSSIAKYLTSNYEQGKLVEMYDAIKSQTEAQEARQLTAKDLGYDIMPNFADENFMALKSLNRNIADTILKPSDENYRVIAGADSVSLETKNKAVLSGYDLSATSMYTFGDKRLDNKNRLGLGLSFTQLSSSYDRGGSRDLNIVSVFIPYLHKFTEKLNLASILSFGYGYGDLERGGNKKADINDIFYGFTNELRYTIDLNGFASLEPALYLNAIGYTEDGLDEGSSELALATNKTHNLSVEAGIGLFLKKEVSLEKYGKLGFKVGGAYYRELGSPYDDIRARVKGSNGWYSINDYANIYTHDRALLEAAIDYEYKDLSIYAKFNQIIQKNNPKLFDLGIKYKF